MKTITITPAVHRRVIDPKTNQVLPEGTTKVEASSYWLRRIRQGDVILCEEKPEPIKKQKTLKSDPVAAAKEE
jgi:hypothetical protein